MNPRASLHAADLARIAVFAALIAALGLPGTLTPFGNVVPITAQTLGVMLAGALLGAYRGALSSVVVIVLVAAGLPLLAGGRGGLNWVFAAPTSGYLLAWPVAAFVIGLLTERMMRHGGYRLVPGIAINILGGMVVVYAIGIPFQAWKVGSTLIAAYQVCASFLPGDVIKAVVAAIVAQQVHRALPGGLTGRGSTS